MIQDLVMDHVDHVERLLRSHRVHQHIAMDSNEMFRVEHTVLILRQALVPGSCPRFLSTNLALCVDDFSQESLTLQLNLLAKGVLDGRVVGLNEVALDVSDSEGGFACSRQYSFSADRPVLRRYRTYRHF